jgi:hypothetical protein
MIPTLIAGLIGLAILVRNKPKMVPVPVPARVSRPRARRRS